MAYKKSVKADEDIVSIFLYGAKNFGLEQAEKYHGELENIFTLLSQNPQIARERTEFQPAVRIHFHQMHVIVYIINKTDILILRVLDGRQNWEKFLT